MKSQQQAEREEQQRIKSLVLNYDLHDGEDQDGESSLKPLEPNYNIHKQQAGIEKLNSSHARPEKSSNNRSAQRARKLQLSDVDWYDKTSHNKQQALSSGLRSQAPSLHAHLRRQRTTGREKTAKSDGHHVPNVLHAQKSANLPNNGI